MNEAAILEAIRNTWLGETIRNVSWTFAMLEFLHFFGLCLLFGAMLLVDLRLVGVLKAGSVKSTLRFTHLAIAGFVINLVTGAGFFASNPINYWQNPLFKIKMLLVVLAGLNVIWFELKERKKVEALAEGDPADLDTRIVAGLSLVLWTLIIILGRFLPTLGAG